MILLVGIDRDVLANPSFSHLIKQIFTRELPRSNYNIAFNSRTTGPQLSVKICTSDNIYFSRVSICYKSTVIWRSFDTPILHHGAYKFCE